VAFCGHDGSVTIEVTPPGEDPDPRLGTKLGDYVVVAHVADGAMGAVYEARNTATRERVAIKVLHSDVAEDDVAVERFNREYETAAMFQHPNIVKVLDFGKTKDGSRFLTMEYLVGQELGELMRREGPQPPARILRVLAQVARALDHAHSYGVIHRDLKPDNIFLCASSEGGDVRLLDFGSVKLQVETGPKLTAFGTTLGSPFYMSPEQAKGLPDVDGRTDVFAMGAILYEALSGKVAFEAPTVAEILMKIVRQKPTPLTTVKPGLPPAMDAVIDRALAKDKKQRFDGPIALVDAALAAFGVQGSCAEWAQRSEAELAAALAAASGAPAPRPAPPPAAPAASPPAPVPVPAAPTARSAPPKASSGVGSQLVLFGGLAVLAFLVAAGIAAFFVFG
jgi:serine/threonine-protein kinase